MNPWLLATIMGIVEGLTEYLPVSSTGHLILAGSFLHYTGEKAATFEIIIQLGAILAVAVLYWRRFWGLIQPNPRIRFSGVRGLWYLFLTSLPASLLGLLTHKFIKAKLFNPHMVAISLAVGAILIFVVEKIAPRPRYANLDEMNTKTALGVGLAQCLSLWPGFSRSASTIMGGMLCGASRKMAAEYSFVAAVPIMIAATGFEIIKDGAVITRADIPFFAIGFVVSFIVAMFAVKAFTQLLTRMTLRPFAVYRLLIAPLVFFFWPGGE